MSGYCYSKDSNGFYFKGLKADYLKSGTWPTDAVDITDSQYNDLMSAQASGATISADENGLPVSVDPLPPTPEELIAAANAKKVELMDKANLAITPYQDAVDIGEATEEEKARLLMWKQYRVQLNRVDTSTAPKIDWPKKPE